MSDDLGPVPGEVSNHPTRERSLTLAVRALAISNAATAGVAAAAVWTITAMMPLKTVQPFLVTFSDLKQQVVRIEPAKIDASAYQMMTEAEVRDYVTSRHTIPDSDGAIEAMWGKRSRLAFRMQPAAYSAFVDANQSDLKAVRSAGLSRAIGISDVAMIGNAIWRVEFETIDTPAGQALGVPGMASSAGAMSEIRTRWAATMRIGYDPQRISYGNRLINPLGFTVLEYSVARKGQ